MHLRAFSVDMMYSFDGKDGGIALWRQKIIHYLPEIDVRNVSDSKYYSICYHLLIGKSAKERYVMKCKTDVQ